MAKTPQSCRLCDPDVIGFVRKNMDGGEIVRDLVGSFQMEMMGFSRTTGAKKNEGEICGLKFSLK